MKFKRKKFNGNEFLLFITIILFIVMYIAGMIVFKDKNFGRLQVFLNLFISNAGLIVAATGMTMLLITGGIDISIGSVIAMTCMLLAWMMEIKGIGAIQALIIVLIVGLIFGLVQGWLISYLKIQPFIVTLAGMFFDEVALMPQSFVNQATARCSVDGAKMWFNCNPAGPYHWFKLEYLDKLKEKNMLHLHFTMDDNLSLSERVKERYKRLYSGVFFKRYILGLWVLAEGIIYDMFSDKIHKVLTIDRDYTQYYVSCDYGTQNPTTFSLWGFFDGVWYKVKEYYYDGRKTGKQKTDEEYYQDLVEFVGDVSIRSIIIDPSAASFIATIKKHGKFTVKKAKNDVIEGIRNMATALRQSMVKFNDCCNETFREFSSYIWDEKAAQRGEDKPIKQNDHAMDADRYFVNTILFKGKSIQILR
jgi:PBSX family phage terminase large subunit